MECSEKSRSVKAVVSPGFLGLVCSFLAAVLSLLPAPVCYASSAIPGWKLLNLDIDRSVSAQKMVTECLDDRTDLHASVNAIRLWTNSKGLKILRASIADWRSKYPNDKWLTFVGSGDFHQVTEPLIDALPKSARPLTIVMIDNHPDWFKAPAHYHCGAWVVQALKHSWVERVILLAQNSEDIRGDQFRFAPFHELCKGRVEMHPLSRTGVLVPLIWVSSVSGVESSRRRFLGTELKFATVHGLGAKGLGERLAMELAGKNVYISIDKDVMGLSEAITDWDQGQLKLTELLTIISKIADSSNLVGMDVCGERAPEPVHGVLKTLDSGREFKRHIRNFDKANLVNEKTNLEIIKAVRQAASISKNVRGAIDVKP